MKVILKETKKTPEEKRLLKSKLEELGRMVVTSNTAQLLGVAFDGMPVENSTLKKNRSWRDLLLHCEKVSKMSGEFVSMDIFYSDIRTDICIYVSENWHKLEHTPSNKFPVIVLWKLYGETKKSLREANMHKVISHIEDWDDVGDSINDFSTMTAHEMHSQGKWYILIEGIANEVGLSAETLRNWERKGKISCERIYHHSPLKKVTYLRGVPRDNVHRFIAEIRKIQEQEKPPVGFLSAKEACKKIGIHRETLQIHREAGKYEYVKIGNAFFYKV